MNNTLIQAWREDDGVLSFEWKLVVSLLVIGIVAGLSGARDAVVDELGDVAQGMLALDQSMTIDQPLGVQVHNNELSSGSDSSFVDALFYADGLRADSFPGQVPQVVDDGIDEGP